jgi:hypothetical protein
MEGRIDENEDRRRCSFIRLHRLWGGGGLLGSGDARIVGPGYVWCTQDGGRDREGRQQQ